MIAARFRSVGWVACIAAAALLFYLMSQWVAAERGALARVDRQIGDTRADIARLSTEIGTRSRMGQLENWNRDVLALKAPNPMQFAANAVELVARAGGTPLPLDPSIVASHGAVSQVALQIAPAPFPPVAPTASRPLRAAPVPAPADLPAASQPILHQATFVRPHADRLAEGAIPVAKVSYHPASDIGPTGALPTKAVAKGKSAKPFGGLDSLLSGDIHRLASREAAARKGDRPAK